MEILAAFDLMGSLRAAADVAGLPITPSPGWSPNATPGARDSLSGPVRRLDRRRVSRGVVTGSHLDTAVQGQSWGPPWATVRPLGWWRLRSHGPGAATGFRASSENGPWARFTRGGRGVGHSWAEETTGSGDRGAAASRRIGRRLGRRRIQEYLAARHTGWAQRTSGPVKRCCGWGPKHSLSRVGISRRRQWMFVWVGPSLRFRRSRLAIREPRPLRIRRAKGWRWESPRWATRVG